MFEWDKSKAIENQSKHGISFADTFGVFEDPNAVTLEDFQRGEQRYVTIGMDAFGRILVVVYTWRGDNIRIISARKAVRYEVRQYEGEI
ncbi:MAG: BrnT family toxin [Candidatus Zixiibacteriota bacterium]